MIVKIESLKLRYRNNVFLFSGEVALYAEDGVTELKRQRIRARSNSGNAGVKNRLLADLVAQAQEIKDSYVQLFQKLKNLYPSITTVDEGVALFALEVEGGIV